MNDGMKTALAVVLLAAVFVAIAVDYRLSQDSPLPAKVEQIESQEDNQ